MEKIQKPIAFSHRDIGCGIALFAIASPLLELAECTKQFVDYGLKGVTNFWNFLLFGISVNSTDALALTLLIFIFYNTLWTIRRTKPVNARALNGALFVVALGLILSASIWSGKVLMAKSQADLRALQVQTFPSIENQINCRERFDQAMQEFLDATRMATEEQIDNVLSRMRQERGFESEIQACLRSLRISGDELADGVTDILQFEESQKTSNTFFLGGPRVIGNVSQSLGMYLSSPHSIVGKSIHFLIVSYPIWPILLIFLVTLPLSLSFDYRTLAKRHWGILAIFFALAVLNYSFKNFGTMFKDFS